MAQFTIEIPDQLLPALVVEFGLVGKTMHQVDERVEVAQIHALKAIYARVLQEYFA